ncbi:MAG: LCP family protein [Clostridiales bacterium]|nr:LCP family protein [Clostridiales bacterium]
MKKKRNRLPRRILNILIVIAAVCVVGYFAFCYWVNASGSLVGHNLPNPEDMDQGSAIVVNGAGRRDGVFTLFIGATDEDEIRTDSMMVLVFDTENHRADLINIPRDTLVDCERTGAGRKINAAYASGVDEMLDEVSTVIGFRPDKYVIANFDGIAEIVDVIGGVDYDVPFDMSYHDASQDLSIEFKKGYQHLDGEEVVEYLRWRHNDDGTGYDDGDIGRVSKLQDFLVTVGDAVLSPTNVLKIPAIASAVSDNVDTDLTTSQILWLGMQGMKMDMQEDISMQTLIGDCAMVNFGDNIWFYILDEDMVIDQINETFNPYIRSLTEEDFSIVTPDTYGIYSESWRNERAVRYAGYKKSDTSDSDDDTEEDTDEESGNSEDDDDVVYYDDD